MKQHLREIKLPNNDFNNPNISPSETPCPSCSKRVTNGPIPCPDGIPGCLVIHYGLRCSKCGKFFTNN